MTADATELFLNSPLWKKTGLGRADFEWMCAQTLAFRVVLDQTRGKKRRRNLVKKHMERMLEYLDPDPLEGVLLPRDETLD